MGLVGAIALAMGFALHPLAVDDAFITFRYAHNLAAGHGFIYNVGQPVLSTTAPLYALLLAAGALALPDLPSLANALSAIALVGGAVLIAFLGQREKTPWVAILAALLYVLYPLLWLSLGLETATFLALGLGAVAAYRRGRLYGAAILLALATMTRGDGLILAAVLTADYVLAWSVQRHAGGALPASTSRTGVRAPPLPRAMPVLPRAMPVLPRAMPVLPRALGALALYAAVMLPLLAWLTWLFGSPLPASLAAKRAQAELGVTGFYAHTDYLQGLGVLARARFAQSPLYVLFLPAVLAGLVAMWRRARWVCLIVGWGLAHFVGYVVLGVTPYYWYYAPLVPGLVCAAALGVVEGARWLHMAASRRAARGLGAVWGLALLAALVWSDWALVQALEGPVPPPESPVSKVLPEAKVIAYEQVGRWLSEETSTDALVGVTEVGIMGYYAGRPMVDFLGLLEPDVAEALQRGDLYWALLRYQPDYLALTAVSPLYAYDLRADPWFQAAYGPVKSFDDPRFWGSPLTIYERRVPYTPQVEASAGGLPRGATQLGVDLGPIRLLGAVEAGDSVQPGGILALTLYWEAQGQVERDYTVFVHLLGQHERVIAQRDAPPGLGAHATSRWAPGQVVVDPYLLAVPGAAYAPDEAMWEVGLYDAQTGQRLATAEGSDHVRFGAVAVRPAAGPLQLDFGPVALAGYDLDRLAMGPGETLRVTLQWEGETPVSVTVQLAGEAGQVEAKALGGLDQEVYVLTMTAAAPPGAYDLEVLVVDSATGAALPLLGADGQPQSDLARLTKVRLYP
jgi:hypothetical protein